MVKTTELKLNKFSLSEEWMLLERTFYICHDMGNIPDNSDKWLHTFIDFLSLFLNRISKAKYNIYSSGIKDLDLYHVIDNSRVFIFILKSDTLQSPAFMEEVKLIQSRCWDNESKILLLKIHATPNIEELQIPFLSTISPLLFFDNTESIRPRLSLRLDESALTSKIILEQLANLAYQIDSFFDHDPGSKKTDDQKPTVYLAESTADQFYNRETLKREIEQHGYKILPDSQLPQNAEEFQTAVNKYLEDSSISVHIMGNEYGEIPKGEVHSVIDLQNKLANNRARQSNKFPKIIWIASNLKITNDLQRKYIENLKHDEQGVLNSEIIQSPLEDFESLLMNRLKMLTPIFKSPQKNENKVYLIYEEIDADIIKEISLWLESNGIETIYTENNGNSNLIKLHRQYLVESKAVLIYNSKHNPTWLNSKITDCLKAPGYGKKNPFHAKVVLLAEHPEGFNPNSFGDFTFIEVRNNFSDTLQPLLNKLIVKAD